jgi:hypothetical protein
LQHPARMPHDHRSGYPRCGGRPGIRCPRHSTGGQASGDCSTVRRRYRVRLRSCQNSPVEPTCSTHTRTTESLSTLTSCRGLPVQSQLGRARTKCRPGSTSTEISLPPLNLPRGRSSTSTTYERKMSLDSSRRGRQKTIVEYFEEFTVHLRGPWAGCPARPAGRTPAFADRCASREKVGRLYANTLPPTALTMRTTCAKLAEAYGNRTRRRRGAPTNGFEDQEGHQAPSRLQA